MRRIYRNGVPLCMNVEKILWDALQLLDEITYLAEKLFLLRNKKNWTVEGNYENDREEIFSKKVKAGKRTYFFDVKATRSNDYYLTITESKRKVKDDGFLYEKHKIFLYKEDFAKFLDALQESVDHVKNDLMADFDFSQFEAAAEKSESTGEFGDDLKWE